MIFCADRTVQVQALLALSGRMALQPTLNLQVFRAIT
jgi:hypothetical protein